MRKGLTVIGLAIAVGAMVATVAAQNPPAAQPPAKAAAAPTPASCGPTPPAEVKHAAKGSRCFEMRTYTFNPAGGNGSVQMLHDRFQKVVQIYFKKHNITVIGVWKPVAKLDTLVYILAFKDAAERDTKWGAFQADPEWLKLRAEMNVSQTVQDDFMVAAEYSPIK